LEQAAERPPDPAAPTPDELQHTIEALRVHQIELEMQSEELRRTQGELETSQARYFDLYNLAPVGYFTLTGDGPIMEANLILAGLLGVARGDLVDQPFSRFVFPEDQDISYLKCKELFETGEPRAWEMRLVRAGTGFFWASIDATRVRQADGAFVCRVVVSDIGEQIRARQELIGAHRRNTAILESIADGFNTFDRLWRCTYVNPAGAKMFGKSAGELIGRTVWELWPQAVGLPFGPGFRGEAAENVPLEVEIFCATPLDGWFEIRYYPSPEGFSLFFTDITQRRRTEETRLEAVRVLELAVKEKTVLLQEVHHRVKNNLAVISGLLSMKADATESEEAKAALETSQKRVHSMALIHEQLYGSSSLDRIDFSDYTGELLGGLRAAFGDESGRISIEMDVDPIEIGIERAVPCALILNELLTNSFKYAFPGERTGTIRVSLHECAPGWLELAVGDDGIGMPAGILTARNTHSLGLKIVGILAKQLEATIEQREVSAGSLIALRFSRAIGKSR
jgi:PAS domain S-box-containing protein